MLKKILLVAFFAQVFIVSLFWANQRASAEVYGYQLNGNLLIGAKPVGNNQVVSVADSINGNVSLELEAIRPWEPGEFDVDKWYISYVSYSRDNTVISSGQPGYWQEVSPLKNKNKYQTKLKANNGEKLDGYYFIVTAIAEIGQRKTNKVELTIKITDPTESTLNENSNLEVPVVLREEKKDEAPASWIQVGTFTNLANTTASTLGSFSTNVKLLLKENLAIQEEDADSAVSISVVSVSAFSSIWYALGFLGVRRRRTGWGKVVDKALTPIHNVKVSLFKEESNRWSKVGETLTTRNGSFDFSLQGEGNYRFVAEKENFQLTSNHYIDSSTIYKIGQEKKLAVPITLIMVGEPKKIITKKSFHESPFLVFITLLILVLGTLMLIDSFSRTISPSRSTISFFYIVAWILCLLSIRQSKKYYIV